MYQALGIMVNKMDKNLCSYGTYIPVGRYVNMLEGDKFYGEN